MGPTDTGPVFVSLLFYSNRKTEILCMDGTGMNCFHWLWVIGACVFAFLNWTAWHPLLLLLRSLIYELYNYIFLLSFHLQNGLLLIFHLNHECEIDMEIIFFFYSCARLAPIRFRACTKFNNREKCVPFTFPNLFSNIYRGFSFNFFL